MAVNVKITHNFPGMIKALAELDTPQLLAAGRRALNRAATTVRKESIPEIQKHIKLKANVIRRDYTWLEKARGSGVDSVTAAVHFSRAALPLLLFVKGSKAPLSQKGIPVKSRRRVRVEIKPGRKLTLKSGFIQRVNSLQVFKRKSSGGLAKQSAPSLAHIVLNKGIGERLAGLAQQTLQRNIIKELEFQLVKAREKIKAGEI